MHRRDEGTHPTRRNANIRVLPDLDGTGLVNFVSQEFRHKVSVKHRTRRGGVVDAKVNIGKKHAQACYSTTQAEENGKMHMARGKGFAY